MRVALGLRYVVIAGLLAAGCSSDKTKPADVAACHDVETISKQINSIPGSLSGIKALYASIKHNVDTLVADSPPSLKSLTDQLESGINAAEPFIASAKSIDALQQLEQSNTGLQAALNRLADAGSKVGDWKSANCKS